MTCLHFEALWWGTERPVHELRKLHRPGGEGPDRTQPSEYVRLKAFEKARPPVSSRWKCRCGRADAFRCWSGVHSRLVLGEARAARGCGWLLSQL